MTWGVETDADEAAAQLVAFHDAGGTLVDTAASYGYGETEELLGSCSPTSCRAPNLTIATKAGITRTPRGPHRRLLARGAAAPARRVAAQARHRLRRPLVRAHRRRHGAVRGDAGARSTPRSPAARCATPGCRTTAAGASGGRRRGSGRCPGGRRSSPNQMRYSLLDRGIEREVVPACLAARRRHLPVVAAGRRRAHRQVPRRRAVRLAGGGRAPARPGRRWTDPGRPASSRRWRPRPTGWPRRRWRWRWPGCATVPAWPRRCSARARSGSSPRSWPARRSTCRVEISDALDDVSAPPIDYPEDVI